MDLFTTADDLEAYAAGLKCSVIEVGNDEAEGGCWMSNQRQVGRDPMNK